MLPKGVKPEDLGPLKGVNNKLRQELEKLKSLGLILPQNVGPLPPLNEDRLPRKLRRFGRPSPSTEEVLNSTYGPESDSILNKTPQQPSSDVQLTEEELRQLRIEETKKRLEETKGKEYPLQQGFNKNLLRVTTRLKEIEYEKQKKAEALEERRAKYAEDKARWRLAAIRAKKIESEQKIRNAKIELNLVSSNEFLEELLNRSIEDFSQDMSAEQLKLQNSKQKVADILERVRKEINTIKNTTYTDKQPSKFVKAALDIEREIGTYQELLKDEKNQQDIIKELEDIKPNKNEIAIQKHKKRQTDARVAKIDPQHPAAAPFLSKPEQPEKKRKTPNSPYL